MHSNTFRRHQVIDSELARTVALLSDDLPKAVISFCFNSGLGDFILVLGSIFYDPGEL